jgi:hypothetical protein
MSGKPSRRSAAAHGVPTGSNKKFKAIESC